MHISLGQVTPLDKLRQVDLLVCLKDEHNSERKGKDELDEHGLRRAPGVANVNDHWNPPVVQYGLSVCQLGGDAMQIGTHTTEFDGLENAFLWDSCER